MKFLDQLSQKLSAGFTIIEVMVAMAIMSIGVLSMGVAQISAIRLSSTSSHLSQAMYLAEEQMEIFHSMPFNATFQIAAANVPDPTNPLIPVIGDSSAYNRTWTIAPNQPPSGLTQITVTVTWTTSNGGRNSVSADNPNYFIPEIDRRLAKRGNYKIQWNQAWAGQITEKKKVLQRPSSPPTLVWWPVRWISWPTACRSSRRPGNSTIRSI